MGIWCVGVLGGDSDCDLLRDYLEIAGADVPPAQFGAPTVFNEGTDRMLLVRHDAEWYVRLRRAYRNADPSRVEAAYPRLVAHAQQREDGVFVFDVTYGERFAPHGPTRSCGTNSFVVLSALILAAGARVPTRLREVCVAACRGSLDALRLRCEPMARLHGGGSVENFAGVQSQKAFLELVRKHKPGTARVLTYAVDADLKAKFKGECDDWAPKAAENTTRRVKSSGALWVPTEEALPKSLDRAFFAASPADQIGDNKKKLSPHVVEATRNKLHTLDPESKDRAEASLARGIRASDRACDVCAAKARPDGQALMHCARCHSVFYCSSTCQKKGWSDGHKKRCKALAAAREQIKDGIKQAKQQMFKGGPRAP